MSRCLTALLPWSGVDMALVLADDCPDFRGEGGIGGWGMLITGHHIPVYGSMPKARICHFTLPRPSIFQLNWSSTLLKYKV
jgi:hypothetical protein